MTSRIDSPDTNADLQLRECLSLSLSQTTGFVMIAGAGSGKTTSLVKALSHLAQTQGKPLLSRGQKIACITYTDIAVKEIWGDVGNASLFHISTIHSFLWTLIRPFTEDIASWITTKLEHKILKANEKIANSRTREATRESLRNDIARYKLQIPNISAVSHFTYGTGSNYQSGILGHSDILKLGPDLILAQPLLRKLVAKRFPIIFVDESQDTNPQFVAALKSIYLEITGNFCLGFFGDPMQKIYMDGIGKIEVDESWISIRKPENFRCPQSILRVINQIRSEDDKLEQVRGRTIEIDGVNQFIEGTANLFIFPLEESNTDRLSNVRKYLSEKNNDPLWLVEAEGEDRKVKILVVVHRMAATRLGFINIYSSLNDNGDTNLKAGLKDGSAWVLRLFIRILLPLIESARNGNHFEVISSLKIHSPLLTAINSISTEISSVLSSLSESISQLLDLMSIDSQIKIREVLNFIIDNQLLSIDERFLPYLDNSFSETSESDGIQAFLASPAKELWNYNKYIKEMSPFATQQGVKGAEFERVMTVLSDEEDSGNSFSYGKYFGFTKLSDKDESNIKQGIDSVIDRTRRLFYVSCSRSTKDLAVVLFAPDVNLAKEAIIKKAIFDRKNIHILPF
ncbi:UvrD-helicase domain-containing protein [Shewanella metallivivens]|uniref:AAA family ATPase n=1 Tax=Shewanella metallivivens TaxID=2872342 RepID=A0ABT5TJ69_9GAMM|nr:UvrD-helicase domain-containing protein [Shewanella metallivivens]MDD8058646.1 AAA family ATPase [Shewanella metallivivens]